MSVTVIAKMWMVDSVFQHGGINVECTPVEDAITIAFHHYVAGMAAMLLVNATPQSTIEYHQKYVWPYIKQAQCRII